MKRASSPAQRREMTVFAKKEFKEGKKKDGWIKIK
jgi:hypothetical protein